MVVGQVLDGHTPEQILENLPTLQLADVYATIGYYLRNRDDVDAYLRERERVAEELRQAAQSDPEYRAFIERVRARARAEGIGV